MLKGCGIYLSNLCVILLLPTSAVPTYTWYPPEQSIIPINTLSNISGKLAHCEYDILLAGSKVQYGGPCTIITSP